MPAKPQDASGWALSAAAYVFIGMFSLLCFIPFWLVYIGSFTAEHQIVKGFQLLPTEFSLDSYRFLLQGSQVYRSAMVSIVVTVTGTVGAVLLTSMFAYVTAHPRVKYRNVLAFYIYFTMLFAPGLVGYYLLISNWLDLRDSIWALILPHLFSAFNAFLMTSYFRTLPFELNEAATVDGAHELYIFFRIIWPISMPVIATITLFYALSCWNDWFNALMFIDDPTKHPLQMMLRRIVSTSQNLDYLNANVNISPAAAGVQLSTVCITIGPIIFLYPFLQRYFIKGMTIGAVKG
ncbi:carbohydrate ABC transporter permease [Paenibacillus mucilaginosus]|uniref:Binding-protein-dependent transport systems inner membrane component n=2 Tax=Paenibacillus mucilaginosus TaxID=61624 RepID=H6NPI1_9BACL|nr:carbohydrate ABC transporter permease [Paenibacillus mucilaginosus]AEI44839.1 binding-protein-dependent transport systems inner membrane component [Paenibacillus mucilaginosus KNP414]AFC32593.1 binding-protein-dependent transport systems inner membrane component [Paenibacillus mucilaginosus 3016]MCG7214886.1 carbohydrate ABC transporter permease [Paenibacillus mucilaginosus]WDM26364.1 carbohydrate ABC transporter permease [Paenibacillus mucilaginosus]WFA21070.1 carbohydrate ABC transporter 